MQSNPPVSPGCECMSGMREPLKSFPLHCFSNRPGLSGEAIQLLCWALLVSILVYVCARTSVYSSCLARPQPVFHPKQLLSSPFYLLNVFSYPLTISSLLCSNNRCISGEVHYDSMLLFSLCIAHILFACVTLNVKIKFYGQVCLHMEEIQLWLSAAPFGLHILVCLVIIATKKCKVVFRKWRIICNSIQCKEVVVYNPPTSIISCWYNNKTDVGLFFGQSIGVCSKSPVQVLSVYLFPFLACQQPNLTMACEQKENKACWGQRQCYYIS